MAYIDEDNIVFRFEEKWSEGIAKHHFTMIPNLLLINMAYLKMTPSELLILLILEKYRYTAESYSYPSIETIAKLSGYQERSVTRLLTAMENKGFMSRSYRRNNSSIYDFDPLIEKLERIA
jgi:DNA-binding MarR family transcriptional regulator